MLLADLLVSYKLVIAPKINLLETEEELPTNKFYRMLEYIQNKKDLEKKKDLEINITTPTQEQVNTEPPKEKSTSNFAFPNSSLNNYKNYNLFKTLFDNYLNSRLDIGDNDKLTIRNILTPIAAMESGFNSSIGNKNSSALGYFQFIDETRKNYTNSSRDEFASDPNKLFEVAINYYNDIKRMLKPYENKIKERGITPLLAVYGMWWRPASIINFLKTGKDDYISLSDRLTLKDILNKAKKWNV